MTWTNYANTGPFTNNTVPPGISATFLNNIESFLDQFSSSIVADNSVSSNGSGAITAVSETLTGSGTGLTVNHNALISGTLITTGLHTANGGLKGLLTNIGGAHTLTDFNFGGVSATSSGVSVTHGIKNAAGTAVAPGVILLAVDNASPSVGASASNVTSTTFTVWSTSNTTVWWLALL